MTMLALDQHPAAATLADEQPAVVAPGESVTPDDDVQERWLQAQPWPRRWFARGYRALRKLHPMFPPMSCC